MPVTCALGGWESAPGNREVGLSIEYSYWSNNAVTMSIVVQPCLIIKKLHTRSSLRGEQRATPWWEGDVKLR